MTNYEYQNRQEIERMAKNTLFALILEQTAISRGEATVTVEKIFKQLPFERTLKIAKVLKNEVGTFVILERTAEQIRIERNSEKLDNPIELDILQTEIFLNK